jgi:hypothetical protein
MAAMVGLNPIFKKVEANNLKLLNSIKEQKIIEKEIKEAAPEIKQIPIKPPPQQAKRQIKIRRRPNWSISF